MARIQCKGCDYKPSTHDTLEGYCMMCAAKKIKQCEQLQAENKEKAKEIMRLETVRRRQAKENKLLKDKLKKAVKFIDETPRYHDSRDTVIDAIKYNLDQALKEVK